MIYYYKNKAYGISGPELEFFNSYLRNRVQYCNINGCTSDFRKTSFGVPQGSILGPLLFLIYMNDLPNSVEIANITMFADDTSLSRSFKSIGELDMELLPVFTNICEWLKANKVNLNTVKTEFMIIGTSKRVGHLDIAPETTPYALFVNDASIKHVWKHHINYISQKIKCNVSILNCMSKVLPTESLCMLYKTLTEPHLRYFSIIWRNFGEIVKDKLKALQNRVARIITRTPFEVANHFALLKHLKWLDVRNIIKLDMGIPMYETMNQLVPGQISEMFICLSTQYSYQTRSMVNGNLFIPANHLMTEQRSLRYAVSKLWNEIPYEIRNANSLNSFKIKLNAYLLEQDIT